MKPPICPTCNKNCSPAGGNIATNQTLFWKCWYCNYEVEDELNKELSIVDAKPTYFYSCYLCQKPLVSKIEIPNEVLVCKECVSKNSFKGIINRVKP